MDDRTPESIDSPTASPDRVRALEERVARLEGELEDLARRHAELGERLLHLSLAAVPEPRFPFWTWYLRNDMAQDTRVRLGMLLMLLSFRARGESIPDPLRKTIEGVPGELLESPEPLTPQEVGAAVAAVAGISHESRLVELFQAMKGQGMSVELCDLYLSSVDGAEGAPDPFPG